MAFKCPFQLGWFYDSISVITHFPTHPFKRSISKGIMCWLLRPREVNGTVFEAEIPAWWQHLGKLSTAETTHGSNTRNQNEKREKKNVPLSWGFYGPWLLRNSVLVPQWDKAICKHQIVLSFLPPWLLINQKQKCLSEKYKVCVGGNEWKLAQ